jgi:hypothetical protein
MTAMMTKTSSNNNGGGCGGGSGGDNDDKNLVLYLFIHAELNSQGPVTASTIIKQQ